MPVQFPDQEDPLEENRAILSSIPAWEIPWTEETGRLQSIESQRLGHGHNWVAEHKATQFCCFTWKPQEANIPEFPREVHII